MAAKRVERERMENEKVALYLGLVHYPVLNRHGDVIASAVTNLDLHDLARLTRTYGLPGCFVITPLQDQQALVAELLDHWRAGEGKNVHPDRDDALRSLRVVDTIDEAAAGIEREWGQKPAIWASSASTGDDRIDFIRASGKLDPAEGPKLLLLGTAWGLVDDILASADEVLEPINGMDEFNHLSVRCAAAIMVDRLLNGRCQLNG